MEAKSAADGRLGRKAEGRVAGVSHYLAACEARLLGYGRQCTGGQKICFFLGLGPFKFSRIGPGRLKNCPRQLSARTKAASFRWRLKSYRASLGWTRYSLVPTRTSSRIAARLRSSPNPPDDSTAYRLRGRPR